MIEETLPSGLVIVRRKVVDPTLHLTPHFTEGEIACKHCGYLYIDMEFLERVEWARDQDEFPYIIKSGYRCLEHNRAEGSQDDSAHPQGLALDIGALYDSNKWNVRSDLERAGLRRMGIYSWGIHTDNDETKPIPCLFWGKP